MMVAPHQSGESLVQNWFRPRAVRRREAEVRRRAEDAIAFLELGPVAHELAGRLSGGQKKLLELGRTMMTDAKLVLLDEPAAGMTHEEVLRTAALIREINQRHALIVVEHDMQFVRMIARTVTVFNQGLILMQDDVAAVLADQRVRDVYLGKQAA